MDPLSDLLDMVRLDGAFFYTVKANGRWHVESAPAKELRPRVLPHAEHLVAYHIVTKGTCYSGAVGSELLELEAGDVIVYPHGDAHVVSSDRHQPRGVAVTPNRPGHYPETILLGDGGEGEVRFVCGFLGCDQRPFNPLLAALPRQLRMRGMSSHWFQSMVEQVTHESRPGRAGAGSVLTRLAEVMFIELLRRHLADLPPGQTGWLAGLRDEVVGRALGLLHSDPKREWTLAELARQCASSRTNLSKRFTELVGQPPMQYLAQWRMQVAANLLTETDAKVSAVGTEVGYGSEAAFSRAFKKATGLAPGAWRVRPRLVRS